MKDSFRTIEKIIEQYWEEPLPEMFERNASPFLEGDHIRDIVGPRRSGKTYLMFLTIRRLMEEFKVPKKATIYLNFENRRLSPLKGDHLNTLIEIINSKQMVKEYSMVYLFLDEIQRLDGWERYVRSIYDEFKGHLRIYISGSSSRLLCGDYASLLTGRHLTFKVMPLDFKEFLRFKGIDTKASHDGAHLSEKDEARVKGLLREYLLYGGFPEIVLRNQKDEILSQLFTDILSRDVIARTSIRNAPVVEEFANFLASNAGGLLSFTKISKYLASRKILVSVPTLIRYFELMKDAFLFFDNTILSYSVRDQNQYPRKIYCVDNGFARLMAQGPEEDWGNLTENAVAIHLYRLGQDAHYWKSPEGNEVDFVIRKKRIFIPIQVCYDVSREDTRAREIGSLIKCMDELEVKEGYLITMNEKRSERINGKRIRYIPLWEFLLSGEKNLLSIS